VTVGSPLSIVGMVFDWAPSPEKKYFWSDAFWWAFNGIYRAF